MPSALPSDDQLAELITPPMIRALMGYGQGALTAHGALVRIIRALPVQRYAAVAQSYGMLPKPEPVAMWAEQSVLDRLAEIERRLESHHHYGSDGQMYVP